jgi:hypothetical protein
MKGVILSLLADLLKPILVWLFGYKAGRDAVVKKSQKETLEDIDEANETRDKLKHDSDYAERVRDRFDG